MRKKKNIPDFIWGQVDKLLGDISDRAIARKFEDWGVTRDMVKGRRNRMGIPAIQSKQNPFYVRKQNAKETAIRIFDFRGEAVRITEIGGEPWFVGKDVAEILGYGNPRQVLATHVDEVDRRASKIWTPSGEQEMAVINESGLYSLIMASKLPAAKEFKHWVTSEVLPSLRKHGAYIMPNAAELNPDISQMLRQAADQIDEANRRAANAEGKLNEVRALVSDLRPKAKYGEMIDQCGDLFRMCDIVKEMSPFISSKAVYQCMKRHGIIVHKKGRIFRLSRPYSEEGYVTDKCYYTNGVPVTETFFTSKGRRWVEQDILNEIMLRERAALGRQVSIL